MISSEHGSYPGLDGAHWPLSGPVLHLPVRQGISDTDAPAWTLDYHTADGITPLGLVWVEDCYAFGSQWAARRIPECGHWGSEIGLDWNNVYVRQIDQTGVMASTARDMSWARVCRAFGRKWSRQVVRIRDEGSALSELASRQVDGRGSALALQRAREHQRKIWLLHFLFMYALKANLGDLLLKAKNVGIPEQDVVASLSGRASLVTEFEQDLQRLANLLGDALGASDASGWWQDMDLGSDPRIVEFLSGHGDRFVRGQDVSSPTLLEDPTALAFLLRTLWESARCSADAAPEFMITGEDSARLRAPDWRQRGSEDFVAWMAFQEAYRRNTEANFIWWSEDHNPVIEWRAGVPLRRACLVSARIWVWTRKMSSTSSGRSC